MSISIGVSNARMSKGDNIIGVASYIFDGDTIALNDYCIRLKGIDTPESMQYCKESTGELYKCGDTSMEFLKDLIEGKEITCKYYGKDVYKRLLGVCFIGNEDINSTMVRNGQAVASVYDDGMYVNQENYAKEHKLGIWSGEFIQPHRWRMKYEHSDKYLF